MDRGISEHTLLSLLDHLTTNASPSGEHDEHWRGWHITRVTGGMNNLLYRAHSIEADLAIKFTIRDKRDRAGREYAALVALSAADLQIAPKPLLLNQIRYQQPVIVQTWLEGEVSTTAPLNDEEWLALLQHLATVHSITPNKINIQLRDAVLGARTAAQAKALVQQQMALLPVEAVSAAAQSLVRCVDAMSFVEWQAPPALCRGDPSIQNFVRRPHAWASVDWENSGWSDPAFEIADLTMQPTYMSVPTSRWDWVIKTYCDLVGDPMAVVRIQSYRVILSAWWVVRMLRYLYEFPRGKDKRLVTPPDGWQAEAQAKYEHYLYVAETLCS